MTSGVLGFSAHQIADRVRQRSPALRPAVHGCKSKGWPLIEMMRGSPQGNAELCCDHNMARHPNFLIKFLYRNLPKQKAEISEEKNMLEVM